MAPAVRVEIHDEFDSLVTSAHDAVMLTIGVNPASGTLSGTTRVNAVGGIATFSGLLIDKGGAGYTLVATSGSLVVARSAAFAITLSFAAVNTGLGEYTCGRTTANVAYCWGNNAWGQFGDGTLNNTTGPVLAGGGLTFSVLSVRGLYGCGVTPAGTLYCWGAGYPGQLGIGIVPTYELSPVAVVGGLSFATVSTNFNHTCGVTTASAAYCWGANAGGELGVGDTITRTTPVAVTGGLTFTAMSVGSGQSCGLSNTGAAYCWGAGGNGGLGDGTATTRTTPVAVAGGLSFATLSLGGGGSSCGLTAAGKAYCWGDNFDGELGDGTTTNRSSPVAVAGGLTFAMVSAGGGHTCGVTSSGAAYCWGRDFNGELGDGRPDVYQTSPVAVSGGLAFATVSAGGFHTCGVTRAGAAYCWGLNTFGELGDGTTTERWTPVAVAP